MCKDNKDCNSQQSQLSDDELSQVSGGANNVLTQLDKFKNVAVYNAKYKK